VGNLVALLVFLAVLGIALCWIFFEGAPSVDNPLTTMNRVEGRTITETTERNVSPAQDTTVKTEKSGAPSPTAGGDATSSINETTTERTTAPESATLKHTSTVMQAPPDTSVMGRIFATEGVVPLLQVGIALLAAFLAAAVVQRVVVGAYGFKIGSLELAELPAVTKEEVSAAVEEITTAPAISALLTDVAGPPAPQPFPQFMVIDGDREQLISIRLETEAALRDLAQTLGIDAELSLDKILDRLVVRQVIDAAAKEGLSKLLELGDRVIAGATVKKDAASQVRDDALHVIFALREAKRRAKLGEYAA